MGSILKASFTTFELCAIIESLFESLYLIFSLKLKLLMLTCECNLVCPDFFMHVLRVFFTLKYAPFFVLEVAEIPIDQRVHNLAIICKLLFLLVKFYIFLLGTEPLRLELLHAQQSISLRLMRELLFRSCRAVDVTMFLFFGSRELLIVFFLLDLET